TGADLEGGVEVGPHRLGFVDAKPEVGHLTLRVVEARVEQELFYPHPGAFAAGRGEDPASGRVSSALAGVQARGEHVGVRGAVQVLGDPPIEAEAVEVRADA